MGLIERKIEGVRAQRELILAFLPWRRMETETQPATPPPKESA